MTHRITILGATGSIGKSTAEVLAQHPDRFRVTALVSGSDVRGLAEMAHRLEAEFVALADASKQKPLREALAGSGIASGAGPSAVIEAVEREAETIVAAISGVAGLAPTHAALKKGRRIGLANKESLVCAGAAFMRDAARTGAAILPMDSEHNALAQALASGHPDDVVTMTLTASGGPFRTWDEARIAAATPAQTAKHPTYSMGAKINVDSASLMNKGLELIEAHHLFGLRPDQLDVVVHPQSIIHGLVHWRDGAVTAGLANPDMKIPIANCLAAERRLTMSVPRLDLAAIGGFTFEAPDEARFPCLRLARAALAAGGGMPAVLNGANEVAVEAFLSGRAGFGDIPRVVEETCAAFAGQAGYEPATVEDALALDREARRIAAGFLPAVSRPAVARV
ncbi:1-deoxy-D-xylulose-5-phosphate reductoisomerase [Enterovirga aerilata]|uniref:1-deoxy-D-xylulose 5-phosphate reductoisomerase n=1 Tax=Enterovirga aerilata TaxID=2730920 RepID=A0A849I871_9HYPH|nr:1-deoxy-D-xylulose-5-phosphate reductoisomerase [Enterovirga sp. DB1703]NNM72495.1 1-deoxy-D-xylulose-5-phosphate reductoisomerase [Enterovirga sp. DB1703]